MIVVSSNRKADQFSLFMSRAMLEIGREPTEEIFLNDAIKAQRLSIEYWVLEFFDRHREFEELAWSFFYQACAVAA